MSVLIVTSVKYATSTAVAYVGKVSIRHAGQNLRQALLMAGIWSGKKRKSTGRAKAACN